MKLKHTNFVCVFKYHIKLQEQQFLPRYPNANVSLLLEAEELLSKLDINCLGKSFCEIGFNSKVNLDDEISLSAQESIRYIKNINYLL